MYFAGSRLYSHTLTGSNTRNVLSPPSARRTSNVLLTHHTRFTFRSETSRIALYCTLSAPRPGSTRRPALIPPFLSP